MNNVSLLIYIAYQRCNVNQEDIMYVKVAHHAYHRLRFLNRKLERAGSRTKRSTRLHRKAQHVRARTATCSFCPSQCKSEYIKGNVSLLESRVLTFIQVFTLPSPTDITLTPFWTTIRHVDNFLLQKSHAPGNPIFKNLLSTIANV